MKMNLLTVVLGTWMLVPGVAAEPAFWDRASALLGEGKVDEADTLAQQALAANPDDADALVVAGTAVLYRRMEPRRDDSIFRPEVDPKAAPEYRLRPEGADAVAAYWKRVPALDPARTYLWADLAQLTFRSGATSRALEFAAQALAAPGADAETLATAASVFALNLDWARAARALSGVPGNRTALLYQGLELWRTGKDGWRAPLKAFVDNPGTEKNGLALAAYMIGPAMRDTEAGFQAAIRADPGMATLAVRQKYVERYPDKFLPRWELAQALSQYGSYAKALEQFAEIDRRNVAPAEMRPTVLFQEAWANQAAGRTDDAAKLWTMLNEARDFYIRSAALWFLGNAAVSHGNPATAKALWTAHPKAPPPAKNVDITRDLVPSVVDEAGRSKYASWCAEELKRLP